MKKQNKAKKKKKTVKEFSKCLVIFILSVTLIDLQICIFLGSENVAKTLIISIIAEFSVYAAKAFFGKKEEEDNKLTQMLYDSIDISEENRNNL